MRSLGTLEAKHQVKHTPPVAIASVDNRFNLLQVIELYLWLAMRLGVSRFPDTDEAERLRAEATDMLEVRFECNCLDDCNLSQCNDGAGGPLYVVCHAGQWNFSTSATAPTSTAAAT
jgi:hypothetical protein